MSGPVWGGWAVGESGGHAKRRRTSPESVKDVEDLGRDVPRPPPRGVESLLSERGSSVSAEIDELESSDDETATMSKWHYTLEMLQEPQRARACGFGDKDRRPLSPPPIIRLWVRTASGQLVDPSHVSIHFLILMVDLWSADGLQPRNVVVHPAASGRNISEQVDPIRAMAHAKPLTTRGPNFVGGWRFTGLPVSATSPKSSPLSSLPTEATVPLPSPDPEWSDRPRLARSSIARSDENSSFPFTAPSPSSPTRHAFQLPSLSALDFRSDTLTLPALRDVPGSSTSSTSADSQHRVSWSTGSSRPSLEAVTTPYPVSSWTDQPRTSGSSSRPPTSNVSSQSPFADPAQHNSSLDSSYGFPATEARRLLPRASTHSRVLVGSLTSVCQRLMGPDGKMGLFFFAHDLGIRTEGSFTLQFTLTNLASRVQNGLARAAMGEVDVSLMKVGIASGDKAAVLAQIRSSPFTVYSAKRFPGVIPTTDLTRTFADQNVRLPTRQRRTQDSPEGSGNEA